MAAERGAFRGHSPSLATNGQPAEGRRFGEMVSVGRSMDFHVFVQSMSQLEKCNDSGANGAGMDKLLGSMNLQVACWS